MQMSGQLFAIFKNFGINGFNDYFDQVGMANSSFAYSVNEESADLATPYMAFEGEPREVDWSAFAILGDDFGPAGQILIYEEQF